jgi:hypothetical protein
LSLLDKAKSVADQATAKAKEGIDDVQARRELGQAYDELGKLAYELATAGEISSPRLDPLVEKIKGLRAESAE